MICGSFAENDLHFKASYGSSPPFTAHLKKLSDSATLRNTLQHTATRCNTLHHYSKLLDTGRLCNTLQHTVRHCNTLQHIWISRQLAAHFILHCKTLHGTAGIFFFKEIYSTLDFTLQETARHRTTLHDTTGHYSTLHGTVRVCKTLRHIAALFAAVNTLFRNVQKRTRGEWDAGVENKNTQNTQINLNKWKLGEP